MSPPYPKESEKISDCSHKFSEMSDNFSDISGKNIDSRLTENKKRDNVNFHSRAMIHAKDRNSIEESKISMLTAQNLFSISPEMTKWA